MGIRVNIGPENRADRRLNEAFRRGGQPNEFVALYGDSLGYWRNLEPSDAEDLRARKAFCLPICRFRLRINRDLAVGFR